MTSYSEYMNGEEQDLPPFIGWPEQRYSIIGSPRTGTNLLCDYLNQLGLGVPMEYFSRWTIETMPDRFGAANPTEYSNALLVHRTSVVEDEGRCESYGRPRQYQLRDHCRSAREDDGDHLEALPQGVHGDHSSYL